MANKKISKTRQKINQIYEENELANITANQTRARSISVGSAGGGIVEINMRGDFSNLWYQMQPTEAIELIGQISASIGVEIAIRPRQDFSSWRSWDTELPSSIAWIGAAPWQLTDEQREEIERAKSKNIKAIEGIDESE
jgi:hypothetical protein